MTDDEVWLRAWLAVAPGFNAKVHDCTRYADACLKDYRERFPPSLFDLVGTGEIMGGEFAKVWDDNTDKLFEP